MKYSLKNVWFSFCMVLQEVNFYQAATIVPVESKVDGTVQELHSIELQVYFGKDELQPKNDTYEVPISSDNFVIKCRSYSPVRITFSGLLPNPPQSFFTTISSKDIGKFYHEVSVNLSSRTEATGRYECLNYSNSTANRTSAFIYTNDSLHKTLPYFLYTDNPKNETDEGIFMGKQRDAVINPRHFKRNIEIKRKCEYDPNNGVLLKTFSFEHPKGINPCKEMTLDTDTIYNLSVNLEIPRNNELENVDEEGVSFEATEKVVQCKNSPLMIHVPCNSPMECEFVRACGNLVLFKTEFTEYCREINAMRGHQLVDQKSSEIRRAELYSDNGLIFCWNEDLSLQREFQFFTDLNGNFVPNLKEIGNIENFMISKLVDSEGWVTEWDNVDEIYTEERELVYCNVSKLLFGSKIQWKFELRNGSLIDAESQDVELISKGLPYYSTKSLIKFSNTNISKIICQANRIDSGEWISISNKIINVEESVPPKVVNNSNQTVVFDSMDKNANLSCFAEGRPLPFITWYQDGQEITDRVNVNYNYAIYPIQSVINISTIMPQLNNTLTVIFCNATNRFNGSRSDLKHFIITTNDK